MALPRKEDYIPREGKVIYILQGPIETDKQGNAIEYFRHGVGFNAEGRGSTSSYKDRTALINKVGGFRDISKKHWEAKAKEYYRLLKDESAPKKKSKTKAEPEPENEVENEVEEEKS